MSDCSAVLLEMHELLAELGALVHLGYQTFDPEIRPEVLVLSMEIKDLHQKLLDAMEYFWVVHKTPTGMYRIPDDIRADPQRFASHIQARGPELFGGLLLVTDHLETLAGAERPLGAEHLQGLVHLLRKLSPAAIRVWS